jgi:F-type H+-transporting ATPase subunit epsilon
METTSGKTVQCVVVTPEKAVLDAQVDFVALPMFDGEVGILPGRAPLIGRLGPGELRIKRGDKTDRFYVDGGFAQVRADVVTVLTPKAVSAEKIDAHAAKQLLDTAKGVTTTPEAQLAQQKTQDRARAQLHIAARAHGGATAASH